MADEPQYHELEEVVEFLSFDVPEARRKAWVSKEGEVWSTFLEATPGFLRKELWDSIEDPDRMTVVIWWRSLADWKAITPEQVAGIDADMGGLVIEPTMRSYRVVRHR